MAELIEGLAPSASSELKKFLKDLKNIKTEIDAINANPLNVNGGRGRGGAGNNRQLLAEIDELKRRLNEQAAAVERLTQVRQRANQRTQEEITNNRLLAQNASLAAQANSTFANSYQRLTAQQAIAARTVQDLIARGRTATQTQRQYNAELRAAQAQFTSLNTRVLAADRAVGRFNRNVGNYPGAAVKGLKDLVAAFGLVGGVTAFAMIAKDIFNTTRQLQSLDLALKNVTQTSEAFGQSQAFLDRISEAYGIEINGLTRSYTGFLAASRNAIESGKLTAQQIQDIFESVAKASGAMGLSVEQQQGAFLALQQMISKGNVQAEEIRGQLAERLPGAFGILAKSMGVTEEVLNKMLKDGEVLAAEVLPAFARELEKAYGVENLERVESLAASTTRLGNAWTDLIRIISDGQGAFSKFLIGSIEVIGKAINGVEEFFKTEEERRNELERGIEQKAYKEQLDRLKQLSEASKEQIDSVNKLNLSDKERLKMLKQIGDSNREIAKAEALSRANGIPQRLKGLRDERNEIYKNIEALKDRIKNAKDPFGNPTTLGTNKYRDQIKAQKELIDNSFRITKSYQGELEASLKFLQENQKVKAKTTELTDKELKELERLRKARERASEEELQNQYRLQRLRLESEQQIFEDIMNDVTLYYSEREEAAADYTDKEIALAELARKEGLRKAGNNKTLQLIVWEEYYKDFADLTKKGEANIRKLQEDSFKEFTDYREKFKGEGLNVINTEDLANEFFKKQGDDAEKAATKVKELRDATNEYIKEISPSFLSEAGLGSLNLFTDLDANGKSPFDKLIEGADTVGEKFAVTFNAIGEVAKEAFAFINQNSQAYFDAEATRLQRQYELEIGFSDQSETAKAEIKRQYDEKQRELRRRESQAQKEQALFNIAINTAQGVTAALTSTPPNVPLSIIIGAIGAAQLALVSSREIPQYWKGTDNHPGGLAIVGDGDKHELIHQPSFGWSVSPKTDTLINLEKGSKVFPDLSKANMFDSGLPDMVQIKGGLNEAQMERVMSKAVKGIKPSELNVNLNHRGFDAYVSSAGGNTLNANNVLSLRGKRV